ncbi:nitrite reductase small subunit NirD [Porticoccus sp. GXU_MW_L64]
MNNIVNITPNEVCATADLVPNSGVCVRHNNEQVAIFFLPKETPQVFAIGNWDPIGKANVISRGIVGDIDGRLVVASPLYKQHFDLTTGECLEDTEQKVPTYHVSIENEKVVLR